MTTKLTLTIQPEIVKEAKIYANKHNTSLSGLIENYLKSLVGKKIKKEKKEIEITPFVKSISLGGSMPADYDYKKDRYEYLANKHK